MGGELVVVVHGIPAPQGSKRHVGHGILVESSKRLRPWRDAVRWTTADAMREQGWTPERGTAYLLYVTFTMSRPASHYRTGKHSGELRDAAPRVPVTNPDLDKLLRSTLDGLAEGGSLVNDSQVVETYAVKTYPGGALDALDSPGAVIVLRETP
jgi:crossover junction endodeoxyribonuclease RusA